MRRYIKVAVFGLSSLLLASCSNKFGILSQEAQLQMLNNLRDGKATLDCGAKCYITWIFRAPSIHQLDLAEKWNGLAIEVIKIGYGNDLAYYYLGKAAQGLGYHQAAIGYYGHALALNSGNDPLFKCASETNLNADACQGVDLVGSIRVSMQVSRDALAQQQAARDAQITHVSEPFVGGLLGTLAGGVAGAQLGERGRAAMLGAVGGALLGNKVSANVDGNVAPAKPASDLKPFVPWPPPPPSYHYQLDEAEWHRQDNKTLGDEATFLVKGLRHLGYGEYSYFDAPNGFVLATALERIQDDGSPDSSARRWGIVGEEKFSDSQRQRMDWWQRLVAAPTGYYRFLLIVVTTDVRGPDPENPTTLEKASSWSREGSVALSLEKASAPIQLGTVAYLNIYEFSRAPHSNPVYDAECKISGELQIAYLMRGIRPP